MSQILHDRVDILMTTYNGERYVLQQIDSILNQSHQNFHIFIRDDLSTDNTKKIIQMKFEENNDRITIVPSNENLGVIQNFSSLFPYAKAPYIMFADQDDSWLPEKISLTLKMMKYLESEYGNHCPLLVHTDLYVVDQNLRLIHPSYWNYAKIHAKDFKKFNRLLVQNGITGCTLMINRPLLELSGSIPHDALMHDWWLALVAAAHGHIGYVNIPTMNYRQHGKNQIGAKQHHILKEFMKMITSFNDYSLWVKTINKKKRQQAKIFLDRYKDSLDKEQIKTVEAFCKNPNSIWNRAYLQWRFGLRKNSFLKNLADLILG